MDSVIKSLVVYFILWLVVRSTGRRTLGQLTVFDFILFLIIGGAAQRALMAQDYSLTHAFLVIATFVLADVAVSLLQRDIPSLARLVKGVPTVVVEDGHVLRGRLRRARISEEDVLEAARLNCGLERMEEIKFAIFEASGRISIIPKREVLAGEAGNGERRLAHRGGQRTPRAQGGIGAVLLGGGRGLSRCYDLIGGAAHEFGHVVELEREAADPGRRRAPRWANPRRPRRRAACASE